MGARAFRMTWLAGLAGVAGFAGVAGIVAACGGGHLVFNVDVYSFIKGTGQDTIPPLSAPPYFIPPGPPAQASSAPQRVRTPGAGSALVDSVLINGTMNILNQAGTGTLGLQLFIASDSAGTWLPGAAALTVTPVNVSGASTTPATVSGRLLTGVDSLFRNSQLWFRVAAQGSATGVTPLQGRMVVTSLILTVWMHRLF
ncbi:MAG TPA: hypothetical protein VM736_03280 [Gemmatimonadales bacterium]|nr:hypothetical protein [Gemmatimonadales bacterium]